MQYFPCPHCKAELEVDDNDTLPGYREPEEVFCPYCKKLATKVFTSGIPSVRVISVPEEK